MLFRTAIMGLAVLAFGAGSAWACSCLPEPTAQEEFGRADVVVRVRLERTEGAKTEDDLIAKPTATHKAVMRVERVFKGDLAEGQLIDVSQGHGSFCGYFFSGDHKGREYLLYLDAARAETKMFQSPMCGRSGQISRATADLKYLERREKLDGKTLLAGVIYDTRPGEAGKKSVTVTVIGGGRTYRATTDKDGYFEIVNLRPGRYAVSVPENVREFYFAPSAKGSHGDYAKPVLGGAAVNVNPGKLTQVAIYLN